MNLSICRQVYFGVFEPILRFGLPFWGNGNAGDLDRLFKIQKRALRILNNANYRQTCRPLFINSRIMTLTNLFIFETSLLIFKNLSEINKCKDIHNYATRSCSNLTLEKPNNELFKKSILYTGFKIYNKLPSKLKENVSFNLFRRELKTFLLNYAFYNLNEFFESTC